MAFLKELLNWFDSALSGHVSVMYFLMAFTDEPVFSSSSPMAFKIISFIGGILASSLDTETAAFLTAGAFLGFAAFVLVAEVLADLATVSSSSDSSADPSASSSAEASASSADPSASSPADPSASSSSSGSTSSGFAFLALAPFLPLVGFATGTSSSGSTSSGFAFLALAPFLPLVGFATGTSSSESCTVSSSA